MWRKTFSLILITLLFSLISSSLLPSVTPLAKYLLLNLVLAYIFIIAGSYRLALIVCLFGGLFENLFGTQIVGLYSTFYSFVILLLIYIKKHIIDNFISSLFVFSLSLYIYFIFIQKVWYLDIQSIVFGLFINILVALLFIFFIKKR